MYLFIYIFSWPHCLLRSPLIWNSFRSDKNTTRFKWNCRSTIYTVLLPQAKDGRVANISKGTNFTGWPTRSQPQACVAVQSGGKFYFQLMHKKLFNKLHFSDTVLREASAEILSLCRWLVFHVLCLIFKIVNTGGGTVKTTPNCRKRTSYQVVFNLLTVYFYFISVLV